MFIRLVPPLCKGRLGGVEVVGAEVVGAEVVDNAGKAEGTPDRITGRRSSTATVRAVEAVLASSGCICAKAKPKQEPKHKPKRHRPMECLATQRSWLR